jgi:hypothetical protein
LGRDRNETTKQIIQGRDLPKRSIISGFRMSVKSLPSWDPTEPFNQQGPAVAVLALPNAMPGFSRMTSFSSCICCKTKVNPLPKQALAQLAGRKIGEILYPGIANFPMTLSTLGSSCTKS